jgi:putative ABC transport system substrate-binding protein
MRKFLSLLIISFSLSSCGDVSNRPNLKIGFLDAFEDATLAEAKKGFFKALNDSGFIAGKNLEVIYRNAQGDIPALGQAVDYFISEHVTLIASNTTLSTITAVQKTSEIPVCMMVSPSPELAGLRGKNGKDPKNLFGVYETLEYIDTALFMIRELFPNAKKIGTLINQSEPQSVDALERIKQDASRLGMEIIALPASNSSETQLVTERLISQGIDVFFALPDNTIFASFETISAACDRAKIPIITSEAGLVGRGALAAFGADIYQWGYASGMEAIRFIRSGKIPAPVKLFKRIKLFNPKKAILFNFKPDSTFSEYK